MPVQTVAAPRGWDARYPRRSPDSDRTGLQPSGHAVLVVDDDYGVRRLTARMLQLQGYDVMEADSGAEALRLLEAKADIELVLTDIVMPGMHGLDLAKHILARGPGPRVVLMTGHAAELSGQLEERDPSIPLLRKPFTSEQLIGMVRRALGEGRH